jgi:deoxyadenosine/deoxycytidine kinase
MSKRKVFLAGCAGIPGVGKTTLLKKLRNSGALQRHLGDSLHVIIVLEPTKLWKAKGWLAAFYANPSKNAAAFQWIVFMTHVAEVEKAIKNAPIDKDLLILVERTMFDQLLFWKQQVDDKCDTADDLYDAAYMMTWKRWNEFIPRVSVIFYFYTSDIQITMRRVLERNRAEEMGVSYSGENLLTESASVQIDKVGGLTLEYQQRLLDKHQQWYTVGVCTPPTQDVQRSIPCVHINLDDPCTERRVDELAKIMALKTLECVECI